ncbi:transporter substrate-binding domain-containing protein [Pseudomonas sp. GD03842]|uniref:substrate-binding periplasmic protein n=1 Tax=Pseudomonas sp. GD03842 TaxID=2975385 RepID=UPI0024486A80|nr:transporter substrate-binding domain-containing protein [Pseudomonas sp. GD03842]MDH0746805.1 transporter substrate-binding domain-containing protein [Pseudomonas sp. GD03842]
MPRLKCVKGLFFLLGLSVLGATLAADSSTAPLRVVTENLAPYNMLEHGKVTGLSTEIVQAVMDTVGTSPRIEVLPWARAYDLALHADNVLIYSIARTPQREHLFKWVGAIAPTSWFLFSLAERPIVLGSLEEAKRYQIATVNQDVGEQYLLAHGFELGKQLQSSSMYEHNYHKLKVDHVELWISNELNVISLMRKNGDDPRTMVRSLALPDLSNPEGLYMAFSLGTPDAVVERYRRALEQVRANGTYDAVVKKWLDGGAGSITD